jgi:HK97 family phage major capsid protein
MNRIKELNEKRGAKLKEASALINAAQTEKRELKPEELTKIQGLHAEAESIGETISTEARQLSLEASKGPVLTKQEQRDFARFDLGIALRALVNGRRLEGIEQELNEEGAKEAREAGIASGSGLCLPRIFVRRGGFSPAELRAMSATGTTTVAGDQGGMTIATAKAGLLDDFYNASVLRGAGATVLEGLTGNLDVPRYVKPTAPGKKAENANADGLSPLTAMLSLQPKRLPAYIDIGERLLMQSSSAIEAVVRRNLTSQMLDVQEVAFFHGGGTNEANGIAGTAGIGSVAGGANGLAPTWANIVALESKVDQQNALLGGFRYFTNGAVRAQLKTTQKAAGTDSTMIIDDRNGGLLNGYGATYTNAISRALTKGTSAGVCSAIFGGNAADYWIGYWGGLMMEILRDSTNAIAGQYRLAAAAYYDGGLVRPVSFAAMLDALTPNA